VLALLALSSDLERLHAMKIILNMAQCKQCGVVIVSTSRHDYRTCKCGAIAVDGGREYLKSSGAAENIRHMAVVQSEDGYFRFLP